MKTLININPLGAVIVPELGLELAAGAEFQAPDEVAEALLQQASNYALKKGKE